MSALRPGSSRAEEDDRQEAEEFRLELMEVVRAMTDRYVGRTPETHPDTESVQLQTALFPELAEARAWARDTAEDTGEGGVPGPGGEPGR